MSTELQSDSVYELKTPYKGYKYVQIVANDEYMHLVEIVGSGARLWVYADELTLV